MSPKASSSTVIIFKQWSLEANSGTTPPYSACIFIWLYIDKDDAEDLAQKINSKNPDTAKIIQANLDIDADVERLVQETKDMFDSIDILVNSQ